MGRVIHRLAERLDSAPQQSGYMDALKSRVSPKVAGLVGIEQELLREAAASLGRQGERLERALAALARIESEFKAAPSEALVSRHRSEREQAERALANLKIQREALGIRNHRELDRRYRIPAPIRLG